MIPWIFALVLAIGATAMISDRPLENGKSPSKQSSVQQASDDVLLSNRSSTPQITIPPLLGAGYSLPNPVCRLIAVDFSDQEFIRQTRQGADRGRAPPVVAVA